MIEFIAVVGIVIYCVMGFAALLWDMESDYREREIERSKSRHPAGKSKID